MIILTSEKARKKKKSNKKKLKNYWKVVHPPKYVDVMVGKQFPVNLKKLSYKSGLDNVDLKGTLKQKDDGFVYLDVSNNVIHGLFSLIDEENIEKPPYFDNGGIGAHISVVSSQEAEEQLKDIKIDEIGDEINFQLLDIKSTKPDGWKEMERVWFVQVESTKLKEIREKYGLSKTYNRQGHNFHVSIAVRPAK